jgi:hypothetical protein
MSALIRNAAAMGAIASLVAMVAVWSIGLHVA